MSGARSGLWLCMAREKGLRYANAEESSGAKIVAVCLTVGQWKLSLVGAVASAEGSMAGVLCEATLCWRASDRWLEAAVHGVGS